MSQIFGGLALRLGSTLAVANAVLITAKHVDFGSDEVTVTEQITEQITEQSSVTPQ